MARRVWLLVEWVEENNITPSYGIVNVDSLCYNESDLQPGKKILIIRSKLNEPSQAQIIRISEKKNLVQEHKDFLERQDQKVKNMVTQLCMRTIKEIKAEPFTSAAENGIHIQRVNLPRVVATNSESDSEDDSEPSQLVHHNRVARSSVKNISYPQRKKSDINSYHHRPVYSPVVNQRRRSVLSSTPLPGSRAQETIKLCFDQGTQTDNSLLQPPLAKIEEMELVLKQLYGRFQSLVMKVNNTNATIDYSEPENNDVSYIEIETNNIYDSRAIPKNSECVENGIVVLNNHLAANDAVQLENNSIKSKAIGKIESDRSINKENPMHVRRMSAQTTEIEMLPIGDGNASVPERLLKDIDWKSYTTATRQLLQAVFPRKVLATHSLTGKQSPAHINKPAKKILDPKLVDDIVKTVSSRCGVPKNLVRNSITVKCTDEAKLYRNRQKNRLAHVGHQNEENIPPSTTPSSEESNNVVV